LVKGSKKSEIYFGFVVVGYSFVNKNIGFVGEVAEVGVQMIF